ncbi:four helix bundle protein [Candidatus Margulisiibacteriota bacterium]
MQNYNSKFKDIIRNRTYKYALEVIRLIEKLPKDATCNVISRQLLRSATSVGANIVEAQAASSRRDFANFMNHSLKSANESKFWLALLRDSKKLENNDIQYVFQETCEICKILAASLLTIRGKRKF